MIPGPRVLEHGVCLYLQQNNLLSYFLLLVCFPRWAFCLLLWFLGSLRCPEKILPVRILPSWSLNSSVKWRLVNGTCGISKHLYKPTGLKRSGGETQWPSPDGGQAIPDRIRPRGSTRPSGDSSSLTLTPTQRIGRNRGCLENKRHELQWEPGATILQSTQKPTAWNSDRGTCFPLESRIGTLQGRHFLSSLITWL